MSSVRALTVTEVLDLPVTIDVVTAGRCFMLGRDASYRAVRDGSFPVQVLKLGSRLVVTRAAVLDVLGIAEPQQAPSNAPPGPVTGPASHAMSSGLRAVQ